MPDAVHVNGALFQNGNSQVLWTDGEIDLGATAEGVSWQVDQTWKDETADQTGVEPQESWFLGAVVSGSFKLKHFTLENLSRALPEGSYSPGTLHGGGGTLAGTISAITGGAAKQLKFKLAAHPTRAVTFWKAVLMLDGAIEAKSDGAVLIPMKFKCYPDTGKARGQRVWKITE